MTDFPIAVLISGGGTTLKNLIGSHQAGALPVTFSLVVSSKATAAGLEHAKRIDADAIVVRKRQFSDARQHSEAVFEACRERGIQLVVMGGYLDHLLIPPDFENRVINIHPSLIPAFCGKGFYGLRVHQAALDFGVKVSGCTVHFVDDEFDHGPIIAQQACPVLDDDSAETLQARVFEHECQLYPSVIRDVANGNIVLGPSS